MHIDVNLHHFAEIRQDQRVWQADAIVQWEDSERQREGSRLYFGNFHMTDMLQHFGIVSLHFIVQSIWEYDVSRYQYGHNFWK